MLKSAYSSLPPPPLPPSPLPLSVFCPNIYLPLKFIDSSNRFRATPQSFLSMSEWVEQTWVVRAGFQVHGVNILLKDAKCKNWPLTELIRKVRVQHITRFVICEASGISWELFVPGRVKAVRVCQMGVDPNAVKSSGTFVNKRQAFQQSKL